ncbi:MAG TPA: hypothetical protein VL614_26050 [Acetobacteraceae bacterium]|nr:hypothetical protein [Acetobacteraceae bacterium]
MGETGLRLHRPVAAVRSNQGIGGGVTGPLTRQRLREQMHKAVADQIVRGAAGPSRCRAIDIEDPPVGFVDHHDRVRSTVEQQSIAFLAATDAGQDAAGHAQPEQGRDAGSTQYPAKQHVPHPGCAEGDFQRKPVGLRLDQIIERMNVLAHMRNLFA